MKAGFDSYISPKVDVGLNLEINEYSSVFANGHYEYSPGHEENSDYSKTSINLISDYIAPEKYWIFGGSKTQTHAKFYQSKYKPYPAKNPVDRSASGFDIGIHSEGKHEGYKFLTGATLKTLDIIDELEIDPMQADESSLRGFLAITGMFKGFEIGGDLLVDFRSVNDNSTNYFRGAGSAKYYSDKMTIDVLAGIEHAVTNIDIQRTALLLTASIVYRLNHLFTMKGIFRGGYEPTSLFGMQKVNPYISNDIIVDYDYRRDVTGMIMFYPDTDLQTSLNVMIGTGSRTPYFVYDSDYFKINYEETQRIKLETELDWSLSMEDNITAIAGFDHCILKRNQNYLPYNPLLFASLNYRKEWTKEFGTKIGFYFVGERYADSDNEESLDAYFDLILNADYKFSESLSFFVSLNNITNSDIYIWKSYKERGIFLSAGVFWQF